MNTYIYNMPYNRKNMHPTNYNYYPNRYIGGGFLLPFALGFASSPLIYNTFNKPYYYPAPPRPYYPYYF